MQRAMSHKKEERAEHEAGDPVLATRTISAHARPCQQDSASDRVANACGNQRRNGLDRVANRQVRRSPHEVDGRERQREFDGFASRESDRWCAWFRHDHRLASYINELRLLEFATWSQGQDSGGVVTEHKLTSK